MRSRTKVRSLTPPETNRRHPGMRSRRKGCNHANVRSTTHARVRREPCWVARRAITDFTPRSHSSRRYSSWSSPRSAVTRSGRWRGRPLLPAMAPVPSTTGGSCVTSLRSAGQSDAQRHAVKVDDQVTFGPNAGAINRPRASQCAASKRTNMAAVEHPADQSRRPRR